MIDDNEEYYARMIVGWNLRRLLREKGVTQTDLGLRLGVASQMISKWTTGALCPSVPNMFRICAAVGVSPNDLMTDEFAMSRPKSAV